MKILTPGKPQAAADAKTDRPALQHPWLETGRKSLYVATTYAAVRLPVEVEDGDTDGTITKDILVAARKNRTDTIKADGELAVFGKNTVRTDRPNGGSFPDIEKVMPTDKDFEGGYSIGLNPRMLADLAESMGASVVRLDFQKSPKGVIRVTPAHFEKGVSVAPEVRERMVAVLMPTTLPDKESRKQ